MLGNILQTLAPNSTLERRKSLQKLQSIAAKSIQYALFLDGKHSSINEADKAREEQRITTLLKTAFNFDQQLFGVDIDKITKKSLIISIGTILKNGFTEQHSTAGNFVRLHSKHHKKYDASIVDNEAILIAINNAHHHPEQYTAHTPCKPWSAKTSRIYIPKVITTYNVNIFNIYLL